MAGVQLRSDDQRPERQFLYADYSPLDDQRNIIKMLEDFVSLAGRIVQLNADNERLAALLKTAEGIRHDASLVVDNIKANTENALDRFHNKYPDPLLTNLHTSSTALLNEGCKTIFGVLAKTNAGIDEQHKKYVEEIASKTERNNTSATNLMESWLAEDYDHLPTLILENLETEITVNIEPGNPKTYSAHCKSSSKRWTDTSSPSIQMGNALPMTYVYRIDTSRLDFWATPKKISSFGVRDLLLPIGMKASISEKLKQVFRLSSKKEQRDIINKDPEFVKVDEYYVSSIKLDNMRGFLSFALVADLAKPDNDFFELTFEIDQISNPFPYQNGQVDVKTCPKLHYFTAKNSLETAESPLDLFQIGDIVQASDLPKIVLFVKEILGKLSILRKDGVIALNGHLEFLSANGADIVTSENNRMKIEYSPLLEFISIVAESLTLHVKILKEKTPVGGELILRQEVDRGERKEYSARLEDLRSRLPREDPWGRRIADTLQL